MTWLRAIPFWGCIPPGESPFSVSFACLRPKQGVNRPPKAAGNDGEGVPPRRNR
jgi:hypothetical protein